jgi:diaminopimelate decarboxylase
MSVTNIPGDIADRCAGVGASFWPFAAETAAREGTPFYVYLPDRAAAAYRCFASAIQRWGTGHVAFSIKTNPLFALLRDLNRWGALAETVSAWEISHAVRNGFPLERIVFNGPMKSEKDLRWALRNPPLTINIDSLDELEAIDRSIGQTRVRAHIGLRLCPPKENGAWSRFGLELSTGELDEALGRIQRSRALELRCIHFHLGTQVHNTTRYIEMIGLVKEVWARNRFSGDVWLDIGGGFPYDHSTVLEEQTFVPIHFFAALADAWGPAPRPVLLAEPGRFISAPAMAVVSRVLACKPRLGEPTIVVLDSGTNHNVMAAFYEHLWAYTGVAAGASHRFCGPLCMEDDILSGERRSAPPETGALVAAFNAGAYSLALSRTFIQPRPPVFALYGDGAHRVLQPREVAGGAYALGPPLAPNPHGPAGDGAEEAAP